MLKKYISNVYVNIKHFMDRLNSSFANAYYRDLYQSDINPTRSVVIHNSGQILNSKEYRNNIFIGDGGVIDGVIQSLGYEGKIRIGKRFYLGPNSRIMSYLMIDIGDNVLISHNCNIFDTNSHPIDAQDRRRDYENIYSIGRGNINGEVECSPVKISDDVWIGANSCIMKGVSIGARSIVAAGAVVVKSVPSDVIVAGNPARIVKYLKTYKGDKICGRE